jgi:D-glycero-alpha-D-manno-heptose 1-phosphate guanylyltransferase
MEAIILAGGFGTRLHSIVKDVPKPMAPIGNRPFLEILMQQLSQGGVNRVVLSIGYLGEIISKYFGYQFLNLEIDYAIETTPLGTGGAAKLALSKIVGDHAILLNGDTFLELSYDEIEKQWQINRDTLMVCRSVPDTSRYGKVETRGRKVYSFNEKGQSGSGLINAGCYVLNKSALDSYPDGSKFPLEENFLKHAAARGEVSCYTYEGPFIDIGIPEDFERAKKELS